MYGFFHFLKDNKFGHPRFRKDSDFFLNLNKSTTNYSITVMITEEMYSTSRNIKILIHYSNKNTKGPFPSINLSQDLLLNS